MAFMNTTTTRIQYVKVGETVLHKHDDQFKQIAKIARTRIQRHNRKEPRFVVTFTDGSFQQYSTQARLEVVA